VQALSGYDGISMEETLQKMDAFFNPHSVAVIGATKKADKAGHVIFKNFVTNRQHGVFQR
jgi:acyl-CoA synthetase (NDP forming)